MPKISNSDGYKSPTDSNSQVTPKKEEGKAWNGKKTSKAQVTGDGRKLHDESQKTPDIHHESYQKNRRDILSSQPKNTKHQSRRPEYFSEKHYGGSITIFKKWRFESEGC